MSNICPVCDNVIADSTSNCPFCGFRLLGSTQQFSPLSSSGQMVINDLQNAANPTFLRNIPTIEQAIPSASLEVIRGPQTGISFYLSNQPFKIGRDPECDIFLNDMTVSRTHALIEPCGDRYRVSDLNSFNGVWVNNENVRVRLLFDGDSIQIGTFCLLFHEN